MTLIQYYCHIKDINCPSDPPENATFTIALFKLSYDQ